MKKIALATLSFFLMCVLEAETPNQNFISGFELLKQHQYEKAIDALNLALKANPKDPYAWERRGYAYFCLENYYQSINDYTLAILLAPSNPLFLMQRALAYHATGNINAMKHDLIAAAKMGEPHAQKFLKEHNITW